MYLDDVHVGDEAKPLVKGPLATAHVMRWSAAVENWHRIHFDHPFATRHDGLPDILVNGVLKQNFLAQMLKDWIGPDGWLWKFSCQHRGMTVPGDTLTAWGRVTSVSERAGLGYVDLEIGLRNQRDEEVCPGRATVVLPKRSGPPVPYPFRPPGGD